MKKKYLKTKTNFCIICKNKVISKIIKTRDNTKKKLFYCNKCDFNFFQYNPIKYLKKNNLDKSRLKFDGLKTEARKIDFENGFNQSKEYFNRYLIDEKIKKKVLEIGSSWGYFLYLLKKKKFNVTGVEINQKKRDFIKKKLKIDCFENINSIEGKKFNYIFLFYTIEYIPNIKDFFNGIYNLLENKGKIIIITPNLNDPIKNIWKNKNYLKFFYEKNAINYFSVKSIKKLFEILKIKNIKTICQQEYSFFNSVNWFLNDKPYPSKIVGGDLINQNLMDEINIKFNKYKKFKKNISEQIKQLDKCYKKFCNNFFFGNQIITIVTKK